MANQNPSASAEPKGQGQAQTKGGREATGTERGMETQRGMESQQRGMTRGQAGRQIERPGQGVGLMRTPLGVGSPFTLVRRMMEDMDRIFEGSLLGRSGLGTFPEVFGPEEQFPSIVQAAWIPDIDIIERGNELIVRVDVPGVKAENVRVEAMEDSLLIEGERRFEQEEESGGYYRRERSLGRFQRQIPLPEGVDAETAHADLKNGVLEIAFKLPESRGRKRITVKSEEGAEVPGEKAIH